ncbi:unnamed protein product [Thelazia callipaeda]|uniref:Acetyltransferase n=1 Tax=Thelazia callipaeda TaxID=103827 RepID=A0A0N5CT77_THECL|nr:unnamed protein product [Thelazia callipaeda]
MLNGKMNKKKENDLQESTTVDKSSDRESEYFALANITKQTTSRIHIHLNKNAILNTTNNESNDRNTAGKEEDSHYDKLGLISEFAINHTPSDDQTASSLLKSFTQFVVCQDSGTIDALLGFYRKNRYVVQDIQGKLVKSLKNL